MKRILTGLFLTLILISGCSDEKSVERGNTVSSNIYPPKVQFEIEETKYRAEQGSYCWRHDNSAECLSLPSLTEIIEYKKPITVSKKETIHLLVERKPSQETLTLLNTESNQTEEIQFSKNYKFKAPAIEGIYILDYYAIWEKDKSGTSGDSSFVFKIEVK